MIDSGIFSFVRHNTEIKINFTPIRLSKTEYLNDALEWVTLFSVL